MLLKDAKWATVNDLASEWAGEPGALGRDEIWLNLWAAFWRGRFEATEGFGILHDGDWLRGDQERGEFNPLSRAFLLNWLAANGDIDFTLKSPPVAFIPNSDLSGHPDDYERLARWGIRQYQALSEEIRVAFIDRAAIELSALRAVCEAEGWTRPSFLLPAAGADTVAPGRPPAAAELLLKPSGKQAAKGRKRGPRSIVTSSVKKSMLDALCADQTSRNELDGMKEEEGRMKFGVSRDTFRKARIAALSEFQALTNPDK